MLQGDLVTFPLPDLFQWIDQGRRSGVVEIDTGEGSPFWLEVRDRRIVAACRPPLSQASLGHLAGWAPAEPVEERWPESVADRLVDLFLGPPGGRFALVDDPRGSRTAWRSTSAWAR